MVEDRITDGRRIAELLASELDGREDGELERIAVTNADRDVEPTVEGTRAYDIERVHGTRDARRDAERSDGVERDGERIARAFVHPDRAHLELEVGQDAGLEAARERDLRVRPKATTPPRTIVFVESGAEVKRATAVVQAASRAAGGGDRS